MKKRFISAFKDGIIFKNPCFVQLLGMCSMLAVSVSMTNALGMGIAVTAVLICSNLIISLLRNFIPNEIRIAAYIVIISGFVTAVELIIKAFAPSLDKSLGVFIPLIVVNCIILARAESYASKNKPLDSVIDGLSQGIGYSLALIAMSLVREILGAGEFFGIKIFGSGFKPATMLILPAGGFIVLGLLIALFQKFTDNMNNKDVKATAGEPAAAEKSSAESGEPEDNPEEVKEDAETAETAEEGGEENA